MILPTKHVSSDRSLLTIGGMVLKLLDGPRSPSSVWEQIKLSTKIDSRESQVSYEWFVMTLDFLYAIKAVEYERGLLLRASK